MKALRILALVALALIVSAGALAQPAPATVYAPLPIWGTSASVATDPGAAWTASTRYFSNPIPLWQFDSIHVIFMFPDSANMVAKLQYGWNNSFTAPLDSSASIMGTDSLLTTSSRLEEYSCWTVMAGARGAVGRLVYDFKATKNHAPAYDSDNKFKAWYIGFLKVK